jgi:uncharacterized membrane protein (UPF0127 family)
MEVKIFLCLSRMGGQRQALSQHNKAKSTSRVIMMSVYLEVDHLYMNQQDNNQFILHHLNPCSPTRPRRKALQMVSLEHEQSCWSILATLLRDLHM